MKICTNFILDSIIVVERTRFSKISKGRISVKMYVELWFFFSALRLMVVYISTKIHESIQDSIKVIERTRFHRKNFKGP